MFSYGFMPTGGAMLAVGIVHALCDGFTVSSAAVGVGMVAPPERQASAQGMLGAAETLVGGITAVLAGVLYSWGGRALAYTTCRGRDGRAQSSARGSSPGPRCAPVAADPAWPPSSRPAPRPEPAT